jgi:outer membrane protein
MKRKREDVIVTKEKEYRAFNKILWQGRRCLSETSGFGKPIQDDIYNAIKDMATAGNYA